MGVPLKVLGDVAVVHPFRDHDQVRAMHICTDQGQSAGI